MIHHFSPKAKKAYKDYKYFNVDVNRMDVLIEKLFIDWYKARENHIQVFRDYQNEQDKVRKLESEITRSFKLVEDIKELVFENGKKVKKIYPH